jgi:malonyl-CoA O-methyltransferase
MDMERITLTYPDAATLVRDLRDTGARNSLSARPRGLTSPRRWRQLVAALDARRREGTLSVTWEVVYGHAWKPEPRRTEAGESIVRIVPRRSK